VYISPDSLFDVAKDGRFLISVPEQAGIIPVIVVLKWAGSVEVYVRCQSKSISGHPQTLRDLERKSCKTVFFGEPFESDFPCAPG